MTKNSVNVSGERVNLVMKVGMRTARVHMAHISRAGGDGLGMMERHDIALVLYVRVDHSDTRILRSQRVNEY